MRRQATLQLSELRIAGAGLLAAGVVLPLFEHPGVACPLRSFTGIPCPLCGMSTSVEAAVRLDLVPALAATPAGVAAVVAATTLLFYRRSRSLSVPLCVVQTGLVLMWLW